MNNDGFSIGINRVKNNFFVTIRAVGILTHEEYEKMSPLIDSALRGVQDPRIKVLVDLREFEGWEIQAAWDDLRIGLHHNSQFQRIAIFGNNKKWLDYSIKISSWFTNGELEQFDNLNDATEWLDR